MRTYQTKKDMVYSEIKNKILNGELKPGDRLHIGSIASEYGISEIPVREAIQNLQHDKLAHVVPHAGAVVSPISSKELDEIMELRVYFEGLATYLAVPHIEERQITELEDNLALQEQYFAGERLAEFGALNRTFHRLIYKNNPNERLNHYLSDLLDHSKRYTTVFNENKEFTRGSIRDHKAILAAIKDKNAKKAQELMIRHKERSSEEIKRIWKG